MILLLNEQICEGCKQKFLSPQPREFCGLPACDAQRIREEKLLCGDGRLRQHETIEEDGDPGN